MEQPNHIDDLLRQRLYNAEATPPAFVWPEIERALRKRRRRFLLFLFPGVLGMALAGVAVFRLSNKPLQPVSEAVAVQHGALPVAARGLDSTESADGIGQTSTTTVPSGLMPAENTKTTSQTKSVSAHLATKGGSVFAFHKQVPIEIAPVQRPAASGLAVSSAEAVAVVGTADPLGVQPATSEHPNFPHAGTEIAFLPLNWQYIPDLANPEMPGFIKVPVRKFGQHKRQPKVCYDFEKHPNVWFIDIFGGPSFASKELKTDNSDANQHYLQQRLGTEKRDWAFNGGIRGTLLFSQYFMLRTGLQYEQMTEVFQLVKPNSINVNISRHWDAASGVWTTDTTGVFFGEQYVKVYNRFGMLDIPLQAGVEIRNGRSGFSINAGFTFNVLFWKRGAILTENEVARYFTPGSPNSYEIFKSSTGVSAEGSVQWFYHLQPKLRIFAEPYFRQILQPVSIPGYPIGQRYGIAGIRLGLTKILD